MKCIFTILLVLTFLSQIVYSQESKENVKSIFFKAEDSKVTLNSKAEQFLKVQLDVPQDYEFRNKKIMGTKDQMREVDELNYVHERYEQYYRGIKIEHSDIRIHYLNDKLVSVNGEYINVPYIDISIILSKDEAIQKAKEYINATSYMWEDETDNWLKNIDTAISLYPNAEIVICKNYINTDDPLFHTAYKIDVFAKEPFRHDYVYIEAKSGEVLAVIPILINIDGTAATRYSGSRTISTQQNGSTYRLRDYSRGGGIETYNLRKSTSISNAVDFIDNNNNWTAIEYNNSNKDNGALDAHWGAMMTYDYFKNIHNRNSYNNSGAVLINYVHYGTNYDNAGWNRLYNYMVYGDGGTKFDILTSLDVIAHEIGHGVCQFSANLIYQGESGAINESLSDIWGACVENWTATNKQTWLIGEDIVKQGTALRSMSNPKDFENPNTYGGSYWINPSSSTDDGGVHVNSGVMNHWFYILSAGKSGTNDLNSSYKVAGIGISKAEKIAYRAETVYMTASTNFANARTYTIQAAIDLYGACSPEVLSVTNAWYAVGVGNYYVPTQINTISNVTYTSNTTLNGCGYVLNNVNVQNNSKLTINAYETTINGPFEVQLGSELEIR